MNPSQPPIDHRAVMEKSSGPPEGSPSLEEKPMEISDKQPGVMEKSSGPPKGRPLLEKPIEISDKQPRVMEKSSGPPEVSPSVEEKPIELSDKQPGVMKKSSGPPEGSPLLEEKSIETSDKQIEESIAEDRWDSKFIQLLSMMDAINQRTSSLQTTSLLLKNDVEWSKSVVQKAKIESDDSNKKHLNSLSEKLEKLEKNFENLQSAFEDYNNSLRSPAAENKELIATYLKNMAYYEKQIPEAHNKGVKLAQFSDETVNAFNRRILFYLGFVSMSFTMGEFCMQNITSGNLLLIIFFDMVWSGITAYRDFQKAARELDKLETFYVTLQRGGKNLVRMIRGKRSISSNQITSEGSTSSESTSALPDQGSQVNLEHYPEFQTLESFEGLVKRTLPYRKRSKCENIVNALMPTAVFLFLYVVIAYLRVTACDKSMPLSVNWNRCADMEQHELCEDRSIVAQFFGRL